jgi:hypothetical protein
MQFLFSALLSFLLLAAPAFAQKPTPPAPPPREAPVQDEASGERNDRAAVGLIRRNNVEDLFEPVADMTMVVVRHRDSGMVCRFESAQDALLTEFPGLGRGDDVGCREMRANGEVISFYATRYPEHIRLSAQDQVRVSVAAMTSMMIAPEEWSPPAEVAMSVDGFTPPPSFSGRLLHQGQTRQRHLSRVTIAQVGEWSLKMLYTSAPLGREGPEVPDEGASLIWGTALIDFARDNPALAI